MADLTFAEFAARVLGFERTLSDPKLQRIAEHMGREAQRVAKSAVDADIGGDSFSGWARAPLATKTEYLGDGKLSLRPTRQSAGPWTVAEVGRHMGDSSGFSGPGINIKTGQTARTKSGKLRKVRARKGGKWNGYTRPLSTASDALREIDRVMPGVVDDDIAQAVREFFD